VAILSADVLPAGESLAAEVLARPWLRFRRPALQVVGHFPAGAFPLGTFFGAGWARTRVALNRTRVGTTVGPRALALLPTTVRQKRVQGWKFHVATEAPVFELRLWGVSLARRAPKLLVPVLLFQRFVPLLHAGQVKNPVALRAGPNLGRLPDPPEAHDAVVRPHHELFRHRLALCCTVIIDVVRKCGVFYSFF